MHSIIIDEDTKNLLLEDCKDFLDSEEWYGQRDIPWRRGWLFYGTSSGSFVSYEVLPRSNIDLSLCRIIGAPGCGKTSTINALAGELGLHIYVVPLSKPGMNDASLSALINAVPPRTMILMEDIDDVFTRPATRETSPIGTTGNQSPSNVTLSGLMSVIDGVQAQQGRLLFATTNKYDDLDPALIRPGRFDSHIELPLATKWQAEELFRRIYFVEDTVRTSGAPVPLPTIGADRKKTLLDDGGAVKVAVAAEEEEVPGATRGTVPSGLTQNQRRRSAPLLTPAELEDLATRFWDAIPEHELSVA